MARDKALQILFNTYWSRKGWKHEPTVPLEDYVYARNAGYMFEPVKLDHDDVIKWLKISFSAASLEEVSDAFVASLSIRRLELRSALGSFAIARNFPDHAYQGEGAICTVCGIFKNPNKPYDLSQSNFERHKWGGVLHDQPDYAAFDLGQFAKLERVKPTQRDFDILRRIVETARNCDSLAKPRDLEKRLVDILDSNKAEREILLEILAYCGVLQPSNRPGYFDSFVNYSERRDPPGNRYWTYPVCWWRGVNGINQEALAYYFPKLV